jgi:hypothetical protein
MRVDVTVKGDREAVALVERLSRRLDDNRSQLGSLVDVILAMQRGRFAGRGVRWRRLAPSTIKTDARQGRDPRTLVLTGATMRSVTVRGAPGQIIRLTPTSLTFGTSLYQARIQAKGNANLPKRKAVGMTRAQRQTLVKDLRDLLLED